MLDVYDSVLIPKGHTVHNSNASSNPQAAHKNPAERGKLMHPSLTSRLALFQIVTLCAKATPTGRGVVFILTRSPLDGLSNTSTSPSSDDPVHSHSPQLIETSPPFVYCALTPPGTNNIATIQDANGPRNKRITPEWSLLFLSPTVPFNHRDCCPGR